MIHHTTSPVWFLSMQLIITYVSGAPVEMDNDLKPFGKSLCLYRSLFSQPYSVTEEIAKYDDRYRKLANNNVARETIVAGPDALIKMDVLVVKPVHRFQKGLSALPIHEKLTNRWWIGAEALFRKRQRVIFRFVSSSLNHFLSFSPCPTE